MALVTGALGNLVPKLRQLLQDEYKLQRGVKDQVESLVLELESMNAALCKVAQVPHDKLDPQVKLWASEVREASYDMEDVIDAYLVRVDDGNQTADADNTLVNRFLRKMGTMFSLSKMKARHEIANTIKDITERVEGITKRRKRYRLDDRIASSSASGKCIDPRLLFLHTKVSELVGIDEPRDDLIEQLSQGDDDTLDENMKVVSIFGCGGLGKTTFAQAVYNKLAIDMSIHCKAFVPVGQHPDLKKVFRDILLELDRNYCMNNTIFTILDEGQLIREIQYFLKEKRYIIVMDDIWEVSTWNAIKTALKDNNLGSKIIITTRRRDVAYAKEVHYPYELMPLHHEDAEELFYGRIFGSKEKCPGGLSELSKKILKKCGGVPLAIITLSSLLADKLEDITDWELLCNAIGSGISTSDDGMHNMEKILALSYYNLPSHLKSCFLYLSMFPEDVEIARDMLIWMWISEGFIQPRQKCDDIFELGKTYFNELINRSLIQPMGNMDSSSETRGCLVHDMILDLIRSLSREHNFVTTSEQVISSETKKIVRRLSLHSATTTFPKVDTARVRSLSMFQPSIDSLPSLPSFGVLRVLALVNCYLKDEGIKLNVGSLIHLRCLWVQSTNCKELPEGIEKSQNLQVLRMNKVPDIQPIFWLKQLVYIEGIKCCPMPGKLLRNLASLQVLQCLQLNENSAGAVFELGCLTKLTELCINIKTHMDQSNYDAFISSLSKLRRLQKFCCRDWFRKPRTNSFLNWENWMPPPQLHTLRISSDIPLPTLPKWINPKSLPHLTMLELSDVNIIRPEDIEILGQLPSLFTLELWASESNTTGPLQKFVHSAHAFSRATSCQFGYVVTVPSMFPRGAMSKVEHFLFYLRAWDFFSDDGLDFSDLSLEHFPSLQKCMFFILGSDLEEVNKVKEAVKQAVDAHPNHPIIGLC